MANSMYLLTPEDINFISHVVRNYQTFQMWVTASSHPDDFDLAAARYESAEYMVTTIARKHDIDLPDQQLVTQLLATGRLAEKSVEVLSVAKDLADLLDGYTASLS